MVDRERREAIKIIATGAIYVSPVIATMAAPARLVGQGPSPMMMMMFMICDFFPVLCMIFPGLSRQQQRGAPGAAPPGSEGPLPPPPTPLPPSRTNPPPGQPPP